MKRSIYCLRKLALLVLFIPCAAFSMPIVIDTTIGWNGEESVAPFGDVGAAESYGQTFVAPTQHTVLTSFSFWVERAPFDTSNLPIDFAAFVMAWAGDRPTGEVLFQSTQQTVTTIGMQEFSFQTGGLSLLPGQSYLAFLNASNFWDGTTSQARVGFRIDDAYSQGEFWSNNTGQNFSDVTTNSWQNTFPGSDLVFRAAFSVTKPVPEPGTLGLLGAGLVGLCFMRRRKATAERTI